jgi:hypothetical protein
VLCPERLEEPVKGVLRAAVPGSEGRRKEAHQAGDDDEVPGLALDEMGQQRFREGDRSEVVDFHDCAVYVDGRLDGP